MRYRILRNLSHFQVQYRGWLGIWRWIRVRVAPSAYVVECFPSFEKALNRAASHHEARQQERRERSPFWVVKEFEVPDESAPTHGVGIVSSSRGR